MPASYRHAKAAIACETIHESRANPALAWQLSWPGADGGRLTDWRPLGYPRFYMRTTRLRLYGLGILVLGVAVFLLMMWREGPVAFGIVAGLIGLVVTVLLLVRDGWRQTSPQNLMARGIRPDSDRIFSGFDPGLRREYTPMIPTAVSRRISGAP